MKPADISKKLANRRPEPVPGVERGDRVFFRHDDDQPYSGHVICHGKDGCTIDHDGVPRKVRWDSVLGHHTRAERRYEVVDRGEVGAIVADHKGRRKFVAGDLPEPDTRPDKPGSDDYARVQKIVEGATQPLKKALPAVSGRLLFWKS